MKKLAIAMLLLALCATSAMANMVWDPAAQWSATNFGTWEYGYVPTSTGLYTTTGMGFEDRGAVQVWVHAGPADAGLLYNPGGTAVAGIDPYGAALHTGSDGSMPVFRWIAPAAMTVSLDATFYATSPDVTTMAYICAFEQIVFTGQVAGSGQNGGTPTVSFANTYAVSAGDTIDFVLGLGAGETTNSSDLTGLRATITQVPEPCTMFALAAGLGGLIIRRRRA